MIFFIGKQYLSNDRSQNFLIFQSIFNTFKMPAGVIEPVIASLSKRLSNEKTKPSTTANKSLSPKLKWHISKTRVEFKGSCLKQEKVTFTPRNVQTWPKYFRQTPVFT